MQTADDGPVATTYKIVVKGVPEEAVIADLGARCLEQHRGTTVIIVDVIDQAHLRGVLERLHDSNVEIERINPV